MPAVPDASFYDPVFRCWMHTGANALAQVVELANRAAPRSVKMSCDIETPGLTSYKINCVTFAWHGSDGQVNVVLLDPDRADHHDTACRTMVELASVLTFHNGCFDIPVLYHNGLISLDDIDRVDDTLLLTRMALPSETDAKSLEALAKRLQGLDDLAGGLELAFKAAGMKKHGGKLKEAGYQNMDIDAPIYRMGAMGDTAVTLHIEPLLRRMCRDWLTDHPFKVHGATDDAAADAIIATSERANQTMLKRGALGLNIDAPYAERYAESMEVQMQQATALLAQHGLVGGVGKGGAIVKYMAERDMLTPNWPKTKTGLSATKELLQELDHPLGNAQVLLSTTGRVIDQYIAGVIAHFEQTGRCHPQVGIHAASATGRMSAQAPPYQQFSAAARPIFCSDNPDADEMFRYITLPNGDIGTEATGAGRQLWSIDWSQIEPVTMGLMAKDETFLAPFEAGEDLYALPMRAAGISRKIAKVVLLAMMYGQGVASMARRIKHTEESAAQIKRQMFEAMPQCRRWMSLVENVAEQHGVAITAGGRILPVHKAFTYKAVNFCLEPDAKILTADLRHVPAFAVRPGDELVGFDELSRDQRGRGTGKRFFRTAVVEAVSTVAKPSVRVVPESGPSTVCSADHLWLVRVPEATSQRLRWVRADQLGPNHQLLSLGVWNTDESRNAGYLAGLYDGEGSMTNRAAGQATSGLCFSQNRGLTMDAFCAAMDKAGLTYRYQERSARSTSTTDSVMVTGMARMLRTVGTLRPERFIARAKQMFDGVELHTVRQMESVPFVSRIEPVGDVELVSIQTSTRTLIANGYLSHNCIQGSAADVLMTAIDNITKAGLGHTIALAMHDELVLDATWEEAQAVQQIMLTPPPYLERWAQRTPVLRIDAAPLGRAWHIPEVMQLKEVA